MEIHPLDAHPSRGIIILLIRDGKSPPPPSYPFNIVVLDLSRDCIVSSRRGGAEQSKVQQRGAAGAVRSTRAERSEAQQGGAVGAKCSTAERKSGAERGAAPRSGTKWSGARRSSVERCGAPRSGAERGGIHDARKR